MYRHEPFTQPQIPTDFYWLNEPKQVEFDSGLVMITQPETDFWQGTHYGFRRDDGHCLLTRLDGDFALSTQVTFTPKAEYDQCGLMVRLDAENWIKMSIEYGMDATSRLGSVVTNLGYSDWATQDINSAICEVWYRLSKRGPDFLLESSFDGEQWQQMRIAHLHRPFTTIEAGLYACSPLGADFHGRFHWLTIAENNWMNEFADWTPS
jgi:uncharacterized protein